MRWIAVALALCLAAPCLAAGASPFRSLGVGVSAQGKWLSQGGDPASRDVEGAANLALGITQHLAVTGGIAYGFGGSYFREHVDFRITAVDKDDQSMNIWLGAGRYWSEHPADGMNEWAGKAGIGYRLPIEAPLVVGATVAYGSDTGRRSLVVALAYAIKRVGQ